MKKLLIKITGYDRIPHYNLYRLGTEEVKPQFPLNVIKRKYKSGPLNINENNKFNNNPIESKKRLIVFRIIVEKLFQDFGLYTLLSKLVLSDKVLRWINDFNPDIIYTQLSTLELIRFVYNIKKVTNKPLAIHIMDDWPEYLPDKIIVLKRYWKRLIDREFKRLLNHTDYFFAISEGMVEEYKKRYNKEFIAFHNPIEVDKWLPYSKKSWETKSPIRVLYTGRIGVANSNSILTICKTIEHLNKSHNTNIVLEIYTPNYRDRESIKLQKKYSYIEVKRPVAHEQMPKLISSFDLLILPLDFDKKSIHFARLSMPTKASEYMVSGVPIVVFADKATFLVKHALKNKWSIVVDNNSIKSLSAAILNIIKSKKLRRELGENAKLFAINNYNTKKVLSKFETELNVNTLKYKTV